jgi:4-hydroxy-3-methylbut-2-enyl diphosphate reductase IspH
VKRGTLFANHQSANVWSTDVLVMDSIVVDRLNEKELVLVLDESKNRPDEHLVLTPRGITGWMIGNAWWVEPLR